VAAKIMKMPSDAHMKTLIKMDNILKLLPTGNTASSYLNEQTT